MAKNKQKRLLIETKKGGTQSAVKSEKVQLVRSLKGQNQQKKISNRVCPKKVEE